MAYLILLWDVVHLIGMILQPVQVNRSRRRGGLLLLQIIFGGTRCFRSGGRFLGGGGANTPFNITFLTILWFQIYFSVFQATKYNLAEYKSEADKQFANSLAVEKKNKLKSLKGWATPPFPVPQDSYLCDRLMTVFPCFLLIYLLAFSQLRTFSVSNKRRMWVRMGKCPRTHADSCLRLLCVKLKSFLS